MIAQLCYGTHSPLRCSPRYNEPFYRQLEIWGRAQHEAARHRKSDWGKSLVGRNSPDSKVQTQMH